MEHSSFKEKVVIITGASSGIGRELAFQLASQGAWLSLAARSTERLEMVKRECERLGGKAIGIPTDVGELVQCEALIRQTVDRYTRLDMLVNNAGITMFANFEDVRDPGIFEKLMRINYLGSVYCTSYALPYLKQTEGRIVGISSLTGKTGVPTRSGYAASKHAMAGFFDSLRIEVAQYKISVTMIYPGFVATAVREQALGEDGKSVGRSTVKESEVMPVDQCARIILRAATQRKREVVMTLRGKIGMWLKLIAPGFVDRIARRAIHSGR
ncbi:MAG: SDR family oxidoreductase [Ignavibacteriae bacterium]|nr:MAG: SDR family oxidoreductase [Ignavibacteriota bacterium]